MAGSIPAADGAGLMWMKGFNTGIGLDPTAYELDTAISDTINMAVVQLEAAMAVVAVPSTRTVQTTAIKDQKNKAARAICQEYATFIKYNTSIDDDMKLAIGVKPVNRTRTKRNAPTVSPVISVLGLTQGQQTLRYFVDAEGIAGAKPDYATNLQVYRAVADAPVTTVNECDYYESYRRNPIISTFDAEQDGKVATYFARWANAKGEVGPWSLPTSMRIAA